MLKKIDPFKFKYTAVHVGGPKIVQPNLFAFQPRSAHSMFKLTTLCLKNIPDIFDSNLNRNYQILIIFGVNIPDTTCH